MRILICRFLAMICVLTYSAGAHAQQEPIRNIFPNDGYFISVADDHFQDGVRTYTGVKISSPNSAIAIDKIIFTPLLGGDITMHIGAMKIAPAGGDLATTYISGLTVQFSDWPSGEDRVCAWLDVISKAEIESLGVSLASSNSSVDVLRISDLSLEGRPNTAPCWFDGLVAAKVIKVHLQNGSSFEIDNLRSDMALPLSRPAAESSSSGQFSSIKANAESVEAWEQGAAQVFGFSDLSVAARFNANSLQGATFLARREGFLTDPTLLASDIMQAMNAATLLNGQIIMSSPQMRIYSAGVFPTSAVANFRRAGMSTITGSAAIRLGLSRGEIDLQSNLLLSGLVDIKTRTQGTLKPYGRSKLSRARSGSLTGVQMIPEIYPKSMIIDYTDQGLDLAVQDISGVPLGRLLLEYGRIYSNSQPELFVQPSLRMTGWLSTYFRQVASGDKWRLTLQPLGDYSITDIFYRFLTQDVLTEDVLGVSLAPGEK